MEIHKYYGGGLNNPEDPNIPQTTVEIYIRSSTDETFHVDSLAEGIAHLLSNEGCRLTITEYPDGKGTAPQNIGFGVVIKRDGDEIQTGLRAPGVFPLDTNTVILQEPSESSARIDQSTDFTEVDSILIKGTSIKRGQNIPWATKPIWGDTDLPVYSIDEIKEALISLSRSSRDFKDFPKILKKQRKKTIK